MISASSVLSDGGLLDVADDWPNSAGFCRLPLEQSSCIMDSPAADSDSEWESVFASLLDDEVDDRSAGLSSSAGGARLRAKADDTSGVRTLRGGAPKGRPPKTARGKPRAKALRRTSARAAVSRSVARTSHDMSDVEAAAHSVDVVVAHADESQNLCSDVDSAHGAMSDCHSAQSRIFVEELGEAVSDGCASVKESKSESEAEAVPERKKRRVRTDPRVFYTDEELDEMVSKSLQKLWPAKGPAYDEAQGDLGVFMTDFCMEHDIRLYTRAWTQRVRQSIQRVLQKESVGCLHVRCVDEEGEKVIELCHDELKQVLRDVLMEFDLRAECVSPGQVVAKVSLQLGVEELMLLEGLRLPDRELSVEKARECLGKLSLVVYTRLSDQVCRDFLFDEAYNAEGCKARCRSSKLACAVLYQCGKVCEDGSHFCSSHRSRGEANCLAYGEWDKSRNTLTGLASSVAKSVVRDAKLRSRFVTDDKKSEGESRRPEAFPTSRGFNVPMPCKTSRRGASDVGSSAQMTSKGSRRVLRQCAQQPEFLEAPAPGELREFSAKMLACPAFPCRLCNSDFACKEALHTHIRVCHKGMEMYRKRLWFESVGEGKPVRPVKPQVWRLTSARMVEELVTGKESYPLCAADEPSHLVHGRKVVLQRLKCAVADCGGLCAFMPALNSDGRRLAGDEWQTMSSTDLVALLLEEKGSLYKKLLLAASQSVESQEPANADVSRLAFLVDRARVLPVHDFWWDDGYILSDLASVLGVDFVDHRVTDFRNRVFEGSAMPKWPDDTSSLLPMLRCARDVSCRASHVVSQAILDLRSLEEHDFAFFSDALLEKILVFVANDRWDHRCMYHEGLALRLFAEFHELAVPHPKWSFPTLEAPVEASEWWTGTLEVAESPVVSEREDTEAVPVASVQSTEPFVSKVHVSSEALGDENSPRRASVRHRRACCVCARMNWGTELKECYMFDAPLGKEHEALLRDTALRHHSKELDKENAHLEDSAKLAAGKTRLSSLRSLFSPKRYRDRWRFPDENNTVETSERGIPLEELEASCVYSPVDGQPWLLHRKAFRVTDTGVALPHQRVPVCGSCHGALSREEPRMPKFSLPNDLWIGKLPRVLRGLSEAAWLLLSLARVSIRRYNCLTDSGRRMPSDQQIKAIVGNVCAYPQADGGCLLQAMPPSAAEIVERLQVCFTGLDKDASRAYVKPLAVKMDEFSRAYQFFRKCNSMYAYVPWHEENAEELRPDPVSKMPRCFSACMRTFKGQAFPESAKQEGPAEAVETNSEPLSIDECESVTRLAEDLRVWSLEHGGPPRGALEDEDFEDSLSQQEIDLFERLRSAVARLQRAGNLDQEGAVVEEAVEEILRQHVGVDMEACVGIADEDMYMDDDKQWQNIIAEYKRILADMQANAQQELGERSADPSSMSDHKNEKNRARLVQRIKELQKFAGERPLAEEAQRARQEIQEERQPPGVQLLPDYRDCSLAELVNRSDDNDKRLLVPCATQPLSMFDAYFWPCAFPRQFPYGDGGFGLARDVAFTLDEYLGYILQREELEYPDPQENDHKERRSKEFLASVNSTLSAADKTDFLAEINIRFQNSVVANESSALIVAKIKDWLCKFCSTGRVIVLVSEWLVQMRCDSSLWPGSDLKKSCVDSMGDFVQHLLNSLFPGCQGDLDLGSSSVSQPGPSVLAGQTQSESSAPGQNSSLRAAPRWVERDFVSGMYCFWRRLSYIRSARLFANRQRYAQSLQHLGALTPDELFDAIGHLKRGQGVKDLLRADDSKVSPQVKSCLRSLQICMNNVLGTNSHRTFLRHVVTGYRNLWGAPLVFTTMNVADTKHPVMKLLYDGGEICTWRLLEQECPAMGSSEDMLRRVSRDPVSQAIFTDLMMRLFLKHMLGVRVEGDATFGDSVAATGAPGLFGDVQAYFAPLESQGRGGLHAHMCVWVLHPMQARILEKLRSGDFGDLSAEAEWKDRLWAWRQEVLEKVSSMQFDSVEEIARQAGADLGEVHKYRDPRSEEAQKAQEVYDRHLADSVSPEAFLDFVGKSKKVVSAVERERLIGRLREIESKLAPPVGASALDPALLPPLEQPCHICSSLRAGSDCPGCRPCVQEDKDAGFHAWHMSLPWRGFVLNHDDESLRSILEEAQACDAADLKRLAFFASVEWFCRSQTWKERRSLVGDAGAQSCKNLLIGSIVSLLALLRGQGSRCSEVNIASSFTEATDDCARSFLEWHGQLLSDVPCQSREDAFLDCIRSADSGHDDLLSCPMAALCLIVSCYAVQVDASVSFVRQVMASLRKHAAGVTVRVDHDPLEKQYLRWRSDRSSDFESRHHRAPDFYAEKFGLSYGDVPPLPLHHVRQQRTCTDGALEKGEAQVREPPVQRSSVCEGPAHQDEEGVVRWRDGPVYEVPSQRQYAPLWTESRGSRGDPCSECPPWRRLPPYGSGSCAGGRAVVFVSDSEKEAQTYGRVFACDARRGYVRSHIHKCKKTCLKKSGKPGVNVGVCQICRFHFVHGREVLWYPRRWPGKLWPCKSVHCSFHLSGDSVPSCGLFDESMPAAKGNLLEMRASSRFGKPVHDGRCPADIPVGVMKRLPRRGKKLVLPDSGCFLPDIGLDEGFGGVGKINVLRYHPDCSSSHPALQVCFRCNFDVQCTDRVFVCTARRQVVRRRRVRRSALSEHTDLPCVDGNLRSELSSSVMSEDQQQQKGQGVLRQHEKREFNPRLRCSLRGGAGIDYAEDFDFIPGEDDEPSDLELFTDEAGPPPFEAFMEEESSLGAGVGLSTSGSSRPIEEPFSDVSGQRGQQSHLSVATQGQRVLDDPTADMLHAVDESQLPEEFRVKRHPLRIQRHWSELIASGKKTVEGRPNCGRPKDVNVGDYLLLNDVQCKVVRRRTYPSFRAMLQECGVEHVTPGLELEEAVRIYHDFPRYEDLAFDNGVVAFDLELTAEQPSWNGDKPVIKEVKEYEEYNVHPKHEHIANIDDPKGRPWFRTAYEAFKRSYRVMSNIAHYQTDYATKSNPMMGNELSEQCVGVERLRKEEVRDGVKKSTMFELMEAGRKTLIRLQTAANRAALKKLPEMVFQMLFRHECYQSHRPWTIFCRGLMWEAFCASEWQKKASERRQHDENWTPGLAWSEEKAALMEEARRVQAEFSSLDADSEQHGVSEPQESACVRIAGRRPRSRAAGARALSGDGPGDVEEDEEDEQAEAEVSVFIAPDRSMKQDWLHRGDREPLASMGLYHYAMFVYTTHVPATAVAVDDYFTYRFAEGHPDASRRVQKLRVHELCRVPKIMGFTLPRADGASADRFRNAMFKSALFRPAYPVDGTARKDELAAAMLLWVDAKGDYFSHWESWWQNQAELADRFEELQRRSQRVFSVADIVCNVGYMQPLGERKFPSAAEFMAHLTMEAATHLEIGAQARAGRTVCPEFDAGDFGTEAGFGRGDGFDGGDGCEVTVPGEPPLAKQTQAVHAIDSVDARAVALVQEIAPEPRLASYFNDFDENMAVDLKEGICGGHERAADASGSFSCGDCVSFDDRQFDTFKDRQKEAFAYVRELDGAVPDTNESVDGVASNGFIYWDPRSDPGLAELQDDEKPRAVEYVEAAIRQLGTGRRPVFLNQEQRDFLALVTSHVRDWEEYLAAKQRHDLEAVEPEPMRVLLCGPGGAGKSELIKVVRGLCEFCFREGSHKALAASNSAARGVGGETVHSGLFLNGRSNFALSELGQAPTASCVDAWKDVHCLMLEEVSMIHPQMLAGMSYRLCKIRQKVDRWKADPELYESDHMFGRMPLVIMLGDFMQLAPIDNVWRRVSLIMPPKDSWPEGIVNGQRIFANSITHAVFLRETHRFKTWNAELAKYEECPVLPRLLEYMRNPDGRQLPSAVASAFKQWEVKRRNDPRRSRREMLEGYEMGIAWHAVARMMQYRALREASAQKRILVYVQAVDTCTQQRLDASQYRKALQVVNMTDTGKLMGMCPLFVGMKVRLNAKLSAKHGLVHDAPGEVVGFQFDPREDLAWQQPGHTASKVGHVVLKYLPKAVYVKFKDVDVNSGFGHGVVAVEPCLAGWDFKTHEQLTGQRLPKPLKMRRRQIPLAPEKVRTVQTAQGLSMDACTMYLNKPGTMCGDSGEDDYWMHLYVMLSRVRSSRNILAYSPPDINFLGRGPPGWMRDGIAALEYVAYRSRDQVQEARTRVGWENREFGEEPPEQLHFRWARWKERNLSLQVTRGCVRQPKKNGQVAKTSDSMEGPEEASKSAPVARIVSSTASSASCHKRGQLDSKPLSQQGNKCSGIPTLTGSSAGSSAGAAQSQQQAKKRQHGSSASLPLDAAAAAGPGQKASRSVELSLAASSSIGAQSRVGSEPQDTSKAKCSRVAGTSGSAQESAGSPAGLPSGSSSSAPSRLDVMHSSHSSYKALDHLRHPTARMVSSEPTVYASLLKRFDMERAVMYYGLDSSEFQLASVCSQVCRRGLPNDAGENNCFINASLQCFLRLDIVAKVLTAHKSRHVQRRVRSRATCAACELADLSESMRSGTLSSAESVVRMVRKGDFGSDFRSVIVQSAFGVGLQHPQCDAPELFLGPEQLLGSRPEYFGLIGVLNRWEEEGFWGGDAVLEARDVNEVEQRRHVLDTHVFGILLRTRKRCTLCSYVVDSLQEDTFLDLGFRLGEDASTCCVPLLAMVQRELAGVLVDEDTKCDRNDTAGCSGQGSSSMIVHRYIEREPPVLVLRLRRVWRDRAGVRKMHARCQFPEVLNFMRSGEYHISGIVLHDGASTKSGHYRAVTWHGDDRYVLYDDDKPVREMKWSQLQQSSVQSQCYMLVYVRTRFWNNIVGDGTEDTPYARDPYSLSFLSQSNLGDSDDRSASGRASNHDSSSVSTHLRSVLSLVSPRALDEYDKSLSWTFEDIAEQFPAHSLFKDLSPRAKEHLALHVPMYGSWSSENSSLRPIQQLLCRMWQEEVYSLFRDLNSSLRGGPCNESLAYLTSWLRSMVSAAQSPLDSARLQFVWRASLMSALPGRGEVISEPWLATTSDRNVAEDRVCGFSDHPPAGLRAVLLQISTAGLSGMQLPARRVDENEILCLPGVLLRVRDVKHQAIKQKEVPLLVLEIDVPQRTSPSGDDNLSAADCSACLKLGVHCVEHSDVCRGMQLEHGCHACGNKNCWAKNPECTLSAGPSSASGSGRLQGVCAGLESAVGSVVLEVSGSARLVSREGRSESVSCAKSSLDTDLDMPDPLSVPGVQGEERSAAAKIVAKRKLFEVEGSETANKVDAGVRAKAKARTASQSSNVVCGDDKTDAESQLLESVLDRPDQRRSARIMASRSRPGVFQDRQRPEQGRKVQPKARSID
jgi:ASC-1-like (ASCH) protein